MQVQKTWDGILNAPVALDDIVFAEMLWAAIKALFSVRRDPGRHLPARHQPRADACCWRCRCSAWSASPSRRIALVFNALAKGYDFFTYYFTLVMTPMTFLSGVYFPIDQMPPWLQGVAAGAAAEGGGRPGAAARSRQAGRPSLLQPLADPHGLCGCGYYLALVLTRRRFFQLTDREPSPPAPQSCSTGRARPAGRRCACCCWPLLAALRRARRRRLPRARKGVPVLGPALDRARRSRSPSTSPRATTSTASSSSSPPTARRSATAQIPPGKVKYDETFEKDVETYRNVAAHRAAGAAARRPSSASSSPARAAPTRACAIRRADAARRQPGRLRRQRHRARRSRRCVAERARRRSAWRPATPRRPPPPPAASSGDRVGAARRPLLADRRRLLRRRPAALAHALRAADAADRVVDHRRPGRPAAGAARRVRGAGGSVRAAVSRRRGFGLAASTRSAWRVVYTAVRRRRRAGRRRPRRGLAERPGCWAPSRSAWWRCRCRCSASTNCSCRRRWLQGRLAPRSASCPPAGSPACSRWAASRR